MGTCVTNCPEGYFLSNGQCAICGTGCSNCSSANVCIVCLGSYYMYQQNCVQTCPTLYPVIKTNVCTACSTPNCITCNSGDSCLSCVSPYLVYVGNCIISCPENFTSNGMACVSNSNQINTNNNTNNTNITNNATQNLTDTFSSSKLFPAPFTIAGIVVMILCGVSKFQNSNTFASGAVYSLLGLLEWGALGVFVLLYYL
jgi:hypothetical protein